MYLLHANLFLTMILIHWVSDFVLQSHWMATNKSKSNRALGLHVATYTASMGVLTVLAMLVQPIWLIFFLGKGFSVFLVWLLVNGVLHFMTDYVTSRATSHLWAKGRTHDFFVVVGLDQVIHYACLFYTMAWLL